MESERDGSVVSKWFSGNQLATSVTNCGETNTKEKNKSKNSPKMSTNDFTKCLKETLTEILKYRIRKYKH